MKFKITALALWGALQRGARSDTTASIGLEMSKANPSADTTKSTVDYMANTNYEPCTCDMTFATCDAFCCCDKYC